MKILITGGAGFVGSHLSDVLLSRGHEVVIVDNFVTGRRQNISHLIERGVRVIEQDINALAMSDEKFDRIYDLSSPASPIDFERMPIFIMKTASLGVMNLLELCRSTGARFLFTSSSEVYGDPLIHPQQEDYHGNCNPVGPRACYDEGKRFGEALCSSYRIEHNVDSRIVRIFNTYGPRMRPNDGRVLPNFFSQALRGEPLTIHGDGLQTRSFCYVTDLARGLEALMESTETRPCNVGNPTETTILDIAKAVLKVTGSKSEIRLVPGRNEDPKLRRPDITRATQSLRWKPEVELTEGLERTFAYFREQL